MNKQRCVVIGGAPIFNYEDVKAYLRSDDYIIVCDCGIKHLAELSVSPDLIVGDFDSIDNPMLDIETIVLPTVKDDTDSVYGVREGIKRGFHDFLLLGMIGRRFDHSLGNVSILLKLDSLHMHALLVDDYSEMEIISSKPAYIDDRYPFFSLINISGTARNINIKNAKYSLTNGEITCEYQYGISNEVIKGQSSVVTVGEGRLLLIKDR